MLSTWVVTLGRCLQLALLGLVRGYRLLLKPWLGNACRFEPTCSAYALQALECHGAWRGSVLTGWRLLRCQPWCAGGHDPVPTNAQYFSARGLLTHFVTAADDKPRAPNRNRS